MTKVKNNLINFFKLITVFFITAITLYRFRVRIPRDIFINTSIYFFILYCLIFVINLLIFILLYLEYKEYKFIVKKNNIFTQINIKLTSWVEESYAISLDIITNLPGIFSTILAYLTYYYTKIPFIILQIINNLSKIVLCIAISYDVFYLEKFQYSYYVLYLILLNLILKAILYISIGIDKRVLNEISDSITTKNYEQTIKNYYNDKITLLNANEFELSKQNKYFTSVEHALTTNHFVINELKQLENFEAELKQNLFFTLAIRLFYIIVFGYISFKYFTFL